MTNRQVADILTEISLILEMDEVAFKPRAYEKAAGSVLKLDKPLKEIYSQGGKKALDDIPSVGESIAEKIEELLKTGKMREYSKLKKKYPIDVLALNNIEGVGPQTIKTLYKKLKIKSIKDLKKALDDGKIRKLKGFGEKTADNIEKSLRFLEKSGGRFILGFIEPEINQFVSDLKKKSGAKKIMVAGSTRRMKETIGDLDLVAVSSNPKKLMDVFTSHPDVIQVLAHGDTKSMVRLSNGLEADLRIIPAKSLGAALSYFTGSREHSVEMRTRAVKNGWTLNEYGLFTNHEKNPKKRKFLAGKTEKELFNKLGLQYIPPEMREVTGEMELAEKKKIPKLVGYGELQGDLQVQTDWTDGSNSIEEMARAAQKQGLKYLAITDHTKSLSVAGGLDEKGLIEQGKEIDKLNKKLKGFKILKGAEVNILKDGQLDINDKVLSKLDVVGIAVHSYFKMTKKEMTNRVMKAMQNPHADILFHPTGRQLQKRPAYQIDIEAIIKAAKKTGTILEIDAYPDRLDLKDSHIKMAVQAGVKLTIDSDGHDVSHFKFLRYGIGQARRGWAQKKDVINTRPLSKMLAALKK